MVANRGFGQVQAPQASQQNGGMAQLVVDAIKGLTKKVAEQAEGFLQAHVREVSALAPEIMRVNLITFHARISSAQAITQAASVRLSADYDYELTGITAAFQAPVGDVTEYADFFRFTMQLRESGRNYDVFDTGAINLGALVSTAGPGALIDFPRGLYLFRHGAEIACTIAVDSVGGTYTAVAKSLVVMLVGNYIRK
jgi:hypothetical protein